MRSCIILTHAYVHDDQTHKLAPIEFAVKHCRKNNPNSYIILAGHGLKPDTSQCDHVYWEDTVNAKDINVGHPRLCNIAFEHAVSQGFDRVLKTRSDSIHLMANIVEYADDLLQDKKLLVTQQTRIDKPQMGDLFMYGDVAFMQKCWNINTWYPTNTGVTSLANNFFAQVAEDNWHDACVNNCAFVDIFNIKWICLQKNWGTINQHKSQVLDNQLENWHHYLWGSQQKWHTWNAQGEFVYSKPKVGRITTERDWQ